MAGSQTHAARPPARWLVATGAGLALLALVEVVVRSGADPDIEVTLLLAALSAAPVALASVAPTPASLLITAATLLILGQDRPLPAAAIAALVLAAYAVGRSRTLVEAALVTAPYLLLVILQPWQETPVARLGVVGLLAAALGGTMLGWARRSRAERAAHQATEQALADTLQDNAAAGERARIARELHDVVAHHISMISVQAETARLTVAGMPEEGARQLSAIGDTARTALTEMRRLLGVLRPDTRTMAQRGPQPGLAQLDALVAQAQASSGTPVQLAIHGTPVPVPPGIDLTAYRVVQEALTNARRHAPGAPVDVELEYGAQAIRVRVRDAGPGPAPDAGDGHGLLGMRERVAMAGGSLFAGPAPDGGYLVSAILPTAQDRP